MISVIRPCLQGACGSQSRTPCVCRVSAPLSWPTSSASCTLVRLSSMKCWCASSCPLPQCSRSVVVIKYCHHHHHQPGLSSISCHTQAVEYIMIHQFCSLSYCMIFVMSSESECNKVLHHKCNKVLHHKKPRNPFFKTRRGRGQD